MPAPGRTRRATSSSSAATSAAYRAGSRIAESARTSTPALANRCRPSRNASTGVPSWASSTSSDAQNRASRSAASPGGVGSARLRVRAGQARLSASAARGSRAAGSLRWSRPACSSRPTTSSINSPSSTPRSCSSLAATDLAHEPFDARPVRRGAHQPQPRGLGDAELVAVAELGGHTVPSSSVSSGSSSWNQSGPRPPAGHSRGRRSPSAYAPARLTRPGLLERSSRASAANAASRGLSAAGAVGQAAAWDTRGGGGAGRPCP